MLSVGQIAGWIVLFPGVFGRCFLCVFVFDYDAGLALLLLHSLLISLLSFLIVFRALFVRFFCY